MTLKIERESLPCSAEQFAALVETHAKAMAEYAAHLRGVEADAANEDLKPEDRRVAFPPPSAHPLVEAAVQAGDFVLVGPSLEVRKQRLCAEVDAAEQAEIAAIMPQRKVRHWQHLVQDARIRLAKGIATDEDDALMTVQAEREKKIAAVQRWAAKAHHDIDDLTDETVDAWEMEPFVG